MIVLEQERRKMRDEKLANLARYKLDLANKVSVFNMRKRRSAGLFAYLNKHAPTFSGAVLFLLFALLFTG